MLIKSMCDKNAIGYKIYNQIQYCPYKSRLLFIDDISRFLDNLKIYAQINEDSKKCGI